MNERQQKALAALEIYREHRDEVRASIALLNKIHGTEAVCVALHVVNLTRFGEEFVPEDVRRSFNGEVGLLVKHWAKRVGMEQKDIALIAAGLWEQMSGFLEALKEAGLGDTNIPILDGDHDD